MLLASLLVHCLDLPRPSCPAPTAPVLLDRESDEPERHGPARSMSRRASGGSPPRDQAIVSRESDGDILVTSLRGGEASDPLAGVNRSSYRITQRVDAAVVGPAAKAYAKIPAPVRDGVRNFVHNLREPIVFLNYLLQLKFGKAAETLGRFVINSVLGIGGVFDVAKRKPYNLPWRPNGFANTLGRWGVRPGPYLFLPLIGPTTVRDLFGGLVDRVTSPFTLLGPFKTRTYAIVSGTAGVLDRRDQLDPTLAAADSSADPYRARREAFLRKRRERIDEISGQRPNAASKPRPAQRPDDVRH